MVGPPWASAVTSRSGWSAPSRGPDGEPDQGGSTESAYLSTFVHLHAKAAALLHSLGRNHGLVDGNKRLALAAILVFYGLNGLRLTLTNDEAYDIVSAVASGQLDEVDTIADVLEQATQPRR